MAPIAPRSSSSKPRTKLPKSVRPTSQSIHSRKDTVKDPLQSFNDRPLSSHSVIPSRKRDKQQIKHSVLLSRLKSSAPGANRIQKKRANERENKKRRTQLRSRLGDLADALPEDQVNTTKGRAESSKFGNGASASKGLKTKPGHTKRLSKLKDMERERFAKNLGAMSVESSRRDEQADGGLKNPEVESPEDQRAQQHSQRWAALRAHITAQQG